MRHLICFVLLGTLLFWSKRTLEREPPFMRALTVQVGSKASQGEVDAAIDDAVLLERALASRAALSDPFVREQLLRALRRESEPTRNDSALISEAIRLGLHRVEPLVRQRLIFQARQVLRAGLARTRLTDAELRTYLSQHAERYELPARRSFQQVFVSRARHPTDLELVALTVRQELAQVNHDATVLSALSEPSLLPTHLTDASESEVLARFGPELASAVFEASELTFVGPARSSYGLHFVRVTERKSARLPTLDEVRHRVADDCRHDQMERDLQTAVRELRREYKIRVRRSTS